MLNQILNTIHQNNIVIDDAEIYKILDLTLLKEDSTSNDIAILAEIARKKNVAAVCVYPKDLNTLPKSFDVQKATVVNFPDGNQIEDDVKSQIIQAITQYSADEIDYVFPYKLYLDGNTEEAFNACQKAYLLCKKHKKIFKVIIESGALPSMKSIYDISSKLCKDKCDFIKTSTGKIATGATVEAVYSILSAIKDNNSNCGIKVSGGIRDFKTASIYIQLAEIVLNKKVSPNWFRIGASGLK
ncbi:MAG: deoxyribose-phosphate aldolase [Legionellaceae bacterium]|nr:deoxyribose-phosphate aldolase [Legionellaceae bacterium]